MNHRHLLVLAAVAGLSGCTPFGGSEGELNHGEFFYRCVGGGDIACDDHKAEVSFELTSTDGSKLPKAMAVGAPFELVFQGNVDGNVSSTTISSASPDLAPHSDIGFAILEPGTVSFLATRGSGRISDFIDVTAEAVDTLNAFHHGVAVTKLALRTDDIEELGAFARGASGLPLSGSLIWGWESSDESVVAVNTGVEDLTVGNETTLLAVGPGTATVTVRSAGKSLSVPVTVTDD